MKKILISMSLLLTLTACNPPDALNVAPSVSTVQGATVQACKFLPTAATVASLLSSSSSISTAASIASAICNAVTSIPLADGPGDRKPRVNGIVIKGQFVK